MVNTSRVSVFMLCVIVCLIATLTILSCASQKHSVIKPDPQPNVHEYIQVITEVPDNLYYFWGSYAVHYQLSKNTIMRLLWLSLITGLLTALFVNRRWLSFIPNMVKTIAAGGVICIGRGLLGWLLPNIPAFWGECLVDAFLSVVISNWGYKGIVKGAFFTDKYSSVYEACKRTLVRRKGK